MDLSAGRGVAVRELKLTPGHGYVDYMLFVDGKAVGVLEAKPGGHPRGSEPAGERRGISELTVGPVCFTAPSPRPVGEFSYGVTTTVPVSLG
jgi:type I restriction enzyme, R subunit